MARLTIIVALLIGMLAGPAAAQEVSITFGDEGSLAARSIQLLVLITVLSLVPGIAIMVTCFPFILMTLIYKMRSK